MGHNRPPCRPRHRFAVNGYAIGVDTVIVTTIRQRGIPDAPRGRVNAANRLVTHGTMALGAALGGLAGDMVGLRTGLLLGCIGALITIVWVFGWPALIHRHGDRLDAPPRVPVHVLGGER
ncbi:MAG TPA: hypothetical protein VI076_16255 [Actinopolymorphaceae bacterium]